MLHVQVPDTTLLRVRGIGFTVPLNLSKVCSTVNRDLKIVST